nr:unnamed protein product [Digitaria exilis]
METIYRLQDLVKWNAGVGPKAGFTRAISSIVQEGVIRFCGPFDHIIEVDMKQAAALSFKDMLTIKVAETLGLLDIQEYNKLKEQDDDVRYFSYGRSNAIDSLWGLTRSVALLSEIFEKLSKKRYLLVVHNLQQPIKPIMLDAFTEDACLPPPMWKRSFWLVSTTSKDVYDRSKVSYVDSYIDSYSYQYPRDIFGGLDWEKILMLTLYSLHQAAKYILNTTRYKDETYWHIVALKCFHYAAMLLIPYCSPPHGEDGDQQNFDARAEITSDELIHRWGAQGILPVINQSCQERMEQVTDSYDQEKVNDDDIYQIGNVILQAFQEYSLLQLPFCPATKADAPTDTAAHFLVYSGLIAEHHMIDELYDDSHPGLEHMQWISHIKCFGMEIFAQKKKLRSLKLIGKILLFLPMLISEAFNLINVHIEGWHSSIEEEVKLEGHPTMRSFRLVNSPHIKRLSLCGCKNLEYVDIKELDALEELNLSATPIKELPSDIPSLPRLRQLLLVGVPSLRRFPWHEVRRLPDVFCLDQYSDGNNTNLSVPQVTQVSIIDSRFFYSFDSDSRNLVRDGKLFRYFYVRVASRKARCRKMQDEEDKSFIKKLQESMPAAYVDVNHCCLTEGLSMVPMDDVPPFQETERHVEISAVERYPHGLKHLLGVTKSISMMDDTHVSILTELFSDWGDLEECMLRRCHRMVQVFAGVPSGLKNACASHLNSLIHFSISPFFSFDALKHLRLEHCPRLEGVIPRGSGLPCLLTLDVQFCYNLKAILYDVGYAGPSSRYQLPCLRRMHLQELPLLKHLHVDDAIVTAPAWEELHVRGCWSLHRLPRLHQRPDKKAAVKVSGERAWWQNLDWEQEDGSTSLHCSSYQPVLPPASACFHEHVVITSYLR